MIVQREIVSVSEKRVLWERLVHRAPSARRVQLDFPAPRGCPAPRVRKATLDQLDRWDQKETGVKLECLDFLESMECLVRWAHLDLKERWAWTDVTELMAHPDCPAGPVPLVFLDFLERLE